MNFKATLKKMINFDSMITPEIINIVYWLSQGLVILAGLALILSSVISFSLTGLFWGLASLFFGVIITRVSFELIIIIFKIHENLKKIADRDTEQDY